MSARPLLTDVSSGVLAVSRAVNSECEHRLGGMRTRRFGRTFDAVFVPDAVCHMTTKADLRRAMETMWVHRRHVRTRSPPCRAGLGS